MKVLRVLGVLVISGLVITSSFGAVRNMTPVEDPLGCPNGNNCCMSGSSCPDIITIISHDDDGCHQTQCYLSGFSTSSNGTYVCWYDCTTNYCMIA